ncbi:MAG: HAD hydrolase-like protein, partial [Anaerovorax sp.]
MQQQKINTIIFDLDGTLVNSIDDLTDNVNRVLGAEGYPKRSLEEVKSFVGNGIPILMERSLPQGTPQEEVLRCLKIFTVYYLHNMHNKTQPYEGIVPVLEELKKRNIKTGV